MILPGGSLLNINASSMGLGTISLVIDSLDITKVSEPFQRLEYSNQFLKDKMNGDGSSPLFITGFGNVLTQITSTCVSQPVRSVATDDANINLINKKFKIKRYTFSGGDSVATEVDKLFTVAAQHRLYLDKFDEYKQELQQPLSYDYFYTTLRAETFSYLTVTGISMTGNYSSNTTEWNILISSFNTGVTHEVPAADGTLQTLVKNWSITVDRREITHMADTT